MTPFEDDQDHSLLHSTCSHVYRILSCCAIQPSNNVLQSHMLFTANKSSAPNDILKPEQNNLEAILKDLLF